MITPRTHCHFMMQARALRVPELCDNHTPPSCLVTNSLAKPRFRSVYTSVLPDPLLTHGGSLTFPVCALYQLFVRLCVLAHHGLHCSHVCAYTHHSLLLHLSLVFAFVTFSSQMEKHQNVRPPTGTTEWNHSHCTGNSLSALHSHQQLKDGTSSTSVQPLASTQETNTTASSGSVSSPQLPHSAISSQVPAGTTRNVTGEIMPTSLAEAVTQLSFLDFLQRCNLLIAPPQPLQLPVPISPLDAATQTLPHRAASRDVSTQTCARPVSSLSLDAAVQTPLHSVVAHDVSTQQPLTEFFIGCILPNDPLDRHALSSAHCNNGNASSPQPPDVATLCSPSSSSHASDGHEHTTAPHALLQPPQGLEKYARQCASHGIPVKAAPVRPRLCASMSVTLPQSHASTTHVGTHPVRSAASRNRSARRALAETHNPVGTDPLAGTDPFPKPRALVLPMVKFGQAKPDGLGHIDTVDSDLMHHQYRLSPPSMESRPSAQEPY